MPPIKKIVLWLVVVFLLYAIFTSPTEAADMFSAAWDIIVDGVSNVASFFDSLISGLTWRADRGSTASSSATSSTARPSIVAVRPTGSTSSARSCGRGRRHRPRALGRRQGVGRRRAAAAPQPQPVLFWWGAAGWLVWRVLNWRRDWFVATDKRFLLFYGFIRRKVAMMPLLKVTDMTYDRSLLGPHRRLRHVRAGVGRSGPGDVGDRPRAGCRHPLPRDLHAALRSRLADPLRPGRLRAPPPRDRRRPGRRRRRWRPGGGRAGCRRPGARRCPTGRLLAEPPPLPSPVSRPESWYRSSNLRGPSTLGDTGEIPVVRVPRDADEVDEVDEDAGSTRRATGWTDPARPLAPAAGGVRTASAVARHPGRRGRARGATFH